MRFKRRSIKKNHVFISVLAGIVVTVLMSLFLGIPTAVIENSIYTRMTPATTLDMFFLIVTSILFGIYTSLILYIIITKKRRTIPAKQGIGGVIGSFFAISCPLCIQLFVWIFGAAFLMKYYNPLRPFIGILSIGLISSGIYRSSRIIRSKCDNCKIV